MALLMNRWTNMCHGWCTSSSIDPNPTFSCQQLVIWYCHGRLRFGWDITWYVTGNCNTIIYFPPKKLQGMTSYVDLTFSVGDIILRFTIRIEQDNSSSWRLDIMFSVVYMLVSLTLDEPTKDIWHQSIESNGISGFDHSFCSTASWNHG